MSWSRLRRKKTPRPDKQMTPYATADVFCRIFTEDMDQLYLLAFLLTGDHPNAERCFFAAFGDCVQGNPVFKEWAHSWSRRVIIKNAIKETSASAATTDGSKGECRPGIHNTLASVTRLDPFERFVFVISVLEGYSDQECSILLSCTRTEVVGARVNALRHLVGVQPEEGRAENCALPVIIESFASNLRFSG